MISRILGVLAATALLTLAPHAPAHTSSQAGREPAKGKGTTITKEEGKLQAKPPAVQSKKTKVEAAEVKPGVATGTSVGKTVAAKSPAGHEAAKTKRETTKAAGAHTGAGKPAEAHAAPHKRAPAKSAKETPPRSADQKPGGQK